MPIGHSPAVTSTETLLNLDETELLSNGLLMDLWLQGRSFHTQRAYRKEVNRFLQYFGRSLSNVAPVDVQAYADFLEEQDLAAASRALALASIKSVLAFGHRAGILPTDGGADLKLPNPKNRLTDRILPETDVLRMLELEQDTRNRALLHLLYAGGLRVSELCALTWRSVQWDGEAGKARLVVESGTPRVVLLPIGLWQELQPLMPELKLDSPIFLSRKKKGSKTPGHLDPAQVARIVRAAAARAGIDRNVSPQWLRHAHASHALDHGVPLHFVQQNLGHVSRATTCRYLHMAPTDGNAPLG